MQKITLSGKNKIQEIRNNVHDIIKNGGKVDTYLNIIKEERFKGSYLQHLKDFEIDISELQNCKIPYLCNDKLNFLEAYKILSYSSETDVKTGLFKIEDIYLEIMKFSSLMKKWNEEKLLNFLEWLGLKPDFKPYSKKLLHIQILDRLFNYKFKLTIDNLKNINKNKNIYLLIDYNLLINFQTAQQFRHVDRNSMICSNNRAYFYTILDILCTVRKNVLQEIIKNMKTNKKSCKKYYNLDTNSIISAIQAHKNSNFHEKYCITSEKKELYDAYLEELKKCVTEDIFRLYEKYELIQNNINNCLEISTNYDKNMTFINLDTWKKNKTSSNKKFINHEYMIISDNSDRFNFIAKYLQNKQTQKIKYNPESSNIIINLVTGLISSNTSNNGKHVNSGKKKRKPIPQKIRYQVWRNAFKDKMDGHCYCCMEPIKFETWECGHIKSHATGGKDTTDNLRPLCRSCNKSMSAVNMLDWMKTYNMEGLKYFK